MRVRVDGTSLRQALVSLAVIDFHSRGVTFNYNSFFKSCEENRVAAYLLALCGEVDCFWCPGSRACRSPPRSEIRVAVNVCAREWSKSPSLSPAKEWSRQAWGVFVLRRREERQDNNRVKQDRDSAFHMFRSERKDVNCFQTNTEAVQNHADAMHPGFASTPQRNR